MDFSWQEEPIDRQSTGIATRFYIFRVEMLESFAKIIFVLDPRIAASIDMMNNVI